MDNPNILPFITPIPVGEIPVVNNPTTGDVFLVSENENPQRTPMQFFLDKINSGIKGTLTKTTEVPPTGYFKYEVFAPGLYTNVTPNINVPSLDFDENLVFITVENGVAKKELTAIPFNDKKVIRKNMFSKNRVQEGVATSYTGGDLELVGTNQFASTDYIDVKGVVYIVITGLDPTQRHGYTWFNENRQPISGSSIATGDFTLENTDNAKYLVIGLHTYHAHDETNNGYDSIMIEDATLSVFKGKSAYVSYSDIGRYINPYAYAIFGDSISTIARWDEDGTYHDNVEENYPTHLRKMLGMTQLWDYAYPGATIEVMSYPHYAMNITYQIQKFIEHGRSADVFILNGGTNGGNNLIDNYAEVMALDETQTAAQKDGGWWLPALKWCIYTLRKNFPNAEIFVCSPLQRADTEPITATGDSVYEKKYKYIKMFAERYCCHFIDQTFESGIIKDFEVQGGNGRWLGDGLHPNPYGKRLQASFIARKIINKIG